jgi:MFS family permease
MTQLPSPSTPDSSRAAGTGAWLALAAALLGWLFDGFEMGVFSQVGRPAIQDLLGTTDEAKVGLWFNVVIACFLVGAATGGVIFGWLGDRIGRVRAMSLSVLTYAVFTGLCGLVGDFQLGPIYVSGAVQLGLLRFIASIGMGGEWSLGVALVMEVWPNRSRAFMAGLIGAAANVGYLLVGFVGIWLNAIINDLGSMLGSLGLSESTVSTLTANQGWRIMMLIGTLPALLTFFIRMFVPESAKWQHEQAQGRTSHWQTIDLLGVLIGCLGPFSIVYVWAMEKTAGIDHSVAIRVAVTLLGLVVAALGFLYPVVRYLGRLNRASSDPLERDSSNLTLRRMLLAAVLSAVALIGTWGSAQQAPSYAGRLIDEQLSDQAAQAMTDVRLEGDETEIRAQVAKSLFKSADRQRLAQALAPEDINRQGIDQALESTLSKEFSPTAASAIAAGLEDAGRRKTLLETLRTKVNAKEHTQIWLAIGAIIGTIGAALIGDWIGRRKAYCLFCFLSLIATWLLYVFSERYGTYFLMTSFLAGTFTAAFYGWFPLYLPELFRTRVRATGQGFGYNFGRVLAAIGALQTGNLIGLFDNDWTIGDITIRHGLPAACSVIALIYVVGMAVIWLAPETKGKPLPE